MRRPTSGWRRALLTMAAAGLPPAATASQQQTGFLDRAVTWEGSTHRYQVYLPAGYTRARRWPVILFLHGAGERGTDGLLQTGTGLGEAIRRHAERWPAIVVFPQAPPEHRWHGSVAGLALAALDRTSAEFAADADRMYLVGLSMGGNGVWNLAYLSPERFAGLVAVCAWVAPTAERPEAIVPSDSGSPYPVIARRVRAIPTWLFHGDRDDVVPVEESRRMVEALHQVGARVRYTELAGVGHDSWTPAFDTDSLPRWLLSLRRAGR